MTEGTLPVVVLGPLVVTHWVVVERTHAARHFLAVSYFLGLFLRLLRVLVQAEIFFTLQSGLTESEGLN